MGVTEHFYSNVDTCEINAEQAHRTSGCQAIFLAGLTKLAFHRALRDPTVTRRISTTRVCFHVYRISLAHCCGTTRSLLHTEDVRSARNSCKRLWAAQTPFSA